MGGYYLHRAQTTFFLASLTCQPYHKRPTKMLHDHTAAHKYGSVFYTRPDDVVTIAESYVYMGIHEGMHALIVTQE
jgi:hypothetical protein